VLSYDGSIRVVSLRPGEALAQVAVAFTSPAVAHYVAVSVARGGGWDVHAGLDSGEVRRCVKTLFFFFL
jgi:hypothetical protein